MVVDLGAGGVRIVERTEAAPAFLRGASYVVDARPSKASSWRNVMTFRRDDEIGIPAGSITVVNSQTAFVIPGWMYAVTTDAGARWTVGDARVDREGGLCCNYGLMEHVELQPDGTGSMRMSVIDPNRGEVPLLVTSDIGCTWTRPVHVAAAAARPARLHAQSLDDHAP